MDQQSAMTPPPIPQSPEPALGGGVRRYHTISSSSARPPPRIVERRESEEIEDDEFSEEYVSGVGTIGEKQASLQRNLSLPTGSRYNRAAPRAQSGTQSGAITPSKTVGSSLSEEEEWSGHGDQLADEEISSDSHSHEATYSSTAAGNVRRHVSLNEPSRPRKGPGLQRFPTVSVKPPRANTMDIPTATGDEDAAARYAEEEEELDQFDEPAGYSQESAYGGMWGPTPDQNRRVDEIAMSFAGMDIHAQQQQQPPMANYAHGGPRFNPATQPSPNYLQQQQQQQQQLELNRRLQLNTHVSSPSGPTSGPAYVPVIGRHQPTGSNRGDRPDLPVTASGAWDQKSRFLTERNSNPNIHQNYQNQYGGQYGELPPPPPIPTQYMNQIQQPGRLPNDGGAASLYNQVGNQQMQGSNPANILSSPVDVPTMIAQKGYNPATFDTRPSFARYFVIKSYTEDDVHKSLKYEIWSSTDPGNKRLDKAFKECAGRGPIYLFFSVNASGHFCGMAEMLTPVDYTRSSTVWASDKWKGVFKVKWIFVRDIPNNVLRNIRLNNTQERKPVTNSRDTQELLPDAGHEMLRIFFTHPAKTSLLQDFAFYELQSLQKQTAQMPQPSQSPAPSHTQPINQHGVPQHPYAMPNPHTVSYANQQQPHNIPQSPPQTSPHQLQQHGMMPNIAANVGGMHSSQSSYGGQVGMGLGSQVAQSVLRGRTPVQNAANTSGSMQGYAGNNPSNGTY